MAIRVALIGTGNVGKPALVHLINDPRFELTGVWVSSEAKAGKDAAELAGLDGSTGITATNDLDAILATDPECAVYTALADNRLPDALEDYRRILSAGVNVVGSSAVFLQYPWQVIPDELLKPIEDAAEAGKSSVFVNGIDPGFANDLLPLALAGTCQSIEQIRCMEIINYDTYDSADVMFDVMGFGRPLDEIPMLLQPGVLSLAWGSVVRQLAAGLGVSLDEVNGDLRARTRAGGLRHRIRSHPEGQRRGTALRGPRNGRRQGRRRPRTRHPAARRPVPGLAATRPGGRVLPHRDHRRAVLRAGPLPEQPATATTTTRARRHRRAGRQCHPRRHRRSAGCQDDARLAPDYREWAVRWR